MKKILTKQTAAVLMALVLCLGMTSVAYADTAFHELTPAKADNAAGIATALADNSAYASGSITRDTTDGGKQVVKNVDDYFKFTIPEDGIVHLRYTMIENADSKFIMAKFIVCGDKEMTNAKATAVEITSSESKSQEIFLKKGTYYIMCQANTSFSDSQGTNTVGVSAAYIPVNGNTTDFTVSYSSKDTTTSDVVVTVKTADPDAKVYAEEGSTASNLIGNDFQWTTDKECPDKEYIIKKNGKYTIRIADSLGGFSQQVITISNIDRTKPSTPTAVNLKSGDTKISGKADAGTLVYVKVGSSTKSVTARDNGSYSLTVSSLKAKAKITLYAQDYAGNKSQSKTYTVK